MSPDPPHPSARASRRRSKKSEDQSVEGILGEQGVIAQALKRYEYRPQQIEMARAVERALNQKQILIVEAATGTGKTLAYLVPALLSGRRVVISTGTKALQEQLFEKDIPTLAAHWPKEIKAVLLKGRRNYLCKMRFEEMLFNPVFRSASDVKHWPRIKAWAAETERGDRAEIEGLPDDYPSWAELSVGSEACLGARCEHYESCFVTKMRKAAVEADLLVVNHHLFFADLAIKQHGFGEVIPEHDAVVFDEAHHLEQIASNYFGMECSNWRLSELIADLKRAIETEKAGASDASLNKVMKRVTQRASSFFAMLSFGRYEGRFPLQEVLQGDQRERIEEAYKLFSTGLSELERELKRFAGSSEVSERLAERAADVKFDVARLIACDDEKYIYFMEIRERGVFLTAAPIDLAELFQKRLLRDHDTLVFTSATLSTNDDFRFFKQRMGLEQIPPLRKPASAEDKARQGAEEEGSKEPAPQAREAVEVRLEPVFDYAEQCLVYVPRRLPAPNDAKFLDGVSQIVEYLVGLCDGGAFVLFTSWANLHATFDALEDKLPYTLLKQGSRPKTELLREFKRDQRAVLFATSSFWEGVDVEGEALKLVIIDKLPFASPSDPLNRARMDLIEARGRSSFHEFSVPSAALMLKQGFGRLIRSRTDTGVVAILDSRIATKRYGAHFIKSLPPAPVVYNASEVKRWWHAKYDLPEEDLS